MMHLVRLIILLIQRHASLIAAVALAEKQIALTADMIGEIRIKANIL